MQSLPLGTSPQTSAGAHVTKAPQDASSCRSRASLDARGAGSARALLASCIYRVQLCVRIPTTNKTHSCNIWQRVLGAPLSVARSSPRMRTTMSNDCIMFLHSFALRRSCVKFFPCVSVSESKITPVACVSTTVDVQLNKTRAQTWHGEAIAVQLSRPLGPAPTCAATFSSGAGSTAAALSRGFGFILRTRRGCCAPARQSLRGDLACCCCCCCCQHHTWSTTDCGDVVCDVDALFESLSDTARFMYRFNSFIYNTNPLFLISRSHRARGRFVRPVRQRIFTNQGLLQRGAN